MKPIKGLTEAARAAGYQGGGYIPVGGLRWLVNKCHVSDSAIDIARDVWRRAQQYPRPLKRAAVRAAILAHRENQRLYDRVMMGGF